MGNHQFTSFAQTNSPFPRELPSLWNKDRGSPHLLNILHQCNFAGFLVSKYCQIVIRVKGADLAVFDERYR